VFAQTPRIVFALACAGCLAIAGGRVYAGSKPYVDLKYDVDPTLRSCPDAVEFRSMIVERLKYDPYREGSALVVEVRAQPSEQGLDGSVRWSSPTDPGLSERHFSPKSQDCHELMATIAFVVAVQLELMATVGPTTRPTAWPAQALPPPRRRPLRLARPESAGPTRLRRLRGLRPAGRLGWGEDPRLGLDWRLLPSRKVGSSWLPSSHALRSSSEPRRGFR
jgi:hypothetical protein